MIAGCRWTASSEFGTYRLCEQRRFRRACASAQSRQNLRWSLIQAVNQEELSDRKPDPWPLRMPGHAQLKFVMTECSKTQIRLTGLRYYRNEFYFCGFYRCVKSLTNWVKPQAPSPKGFMLSLWVIRQSLQIDKIHKTNNSFLIIPTLSSKSYFCRQYCKF